MNEKSIYEMDIKEVNTSLKTVRSEKSTLEAEFNNYTANVVCGVVFDTIIKVNDKDMAVSDFIDSNGFNKAVEEITAAYGSVCSVLFSDGVNNDIVKEMASNLGINTTVFWATVWKKVKIIKKEEKIKKLLNQLEYLEEKEREGEKLEDSK